MTDVRYEPRLVEEAVLFCLRGDVREGAFRDHRDRLYETTDPDEREQGFRKLHLEWFATLGLDQPLRAALAESLQEGGVGRVMVAISPRAADEGVELYQADAACPVVVIALRPERFLDGAALGLFLRHELLHVADMLDPAFGYEPRLPPSRLGPAHDRLLQERYRVLWSATIDGRMARQDRSPAPDARERRFEEFRGLFPGGDEEVAADFARFFDGGPHTHASLLAFANARSVGRAERCPLCGFPSPGLVQPGPEDPALDGLCRDFPRWRLQEGLCRQCADRYRLRPDGFTSFASQ